MGETGGPFASRERSLLGRLTDGTKGTAGQAGSARQFLGSVWSDFISYKASSS